MCLDRETVRTGELRTAALLPSLPLLPTNIPVSWTGIQKGFLQPGPTTLWASLASEHSTTSKEQEHPQNNKVLAQPGLSYSCAWQGPPTALHHLISTAPQITLLCGTYQPCGRSVLVCFSTQAHFIMKGKAETCWEQGSPSLAGFYTAGLL